MAQKNGKLSDAYLSVSVVNVFVNKVVLLVYVVVEFYPWFKFYFPLFCGMVINV